MKKVLVDTNIVIDFALKREPFYLDSVKLFQQIHRRRISGFITASSVTDIFYLLSRSKEIVDVKKFIGDLFLFVDVLNVDKMILLNALQSSIVDFEDAVQNCAAVVNDMDFILTRNKKDFAQSTLKVMTPGEFLLEFN